MLKKINYFNQTYRKKENLVLIHQMGKVGSTSLTKSLKSYGYLPLHIHSFYSPISYEMYKNYHAIKFYRSPLHRLNYFLTKQLVLKLLKSRKKLKVISIVREPVSRNLSMYFQAFHVPLMDINSTTDNRQEANTNLQAFRNDFFQKFNHHYGINWFDNEFKRTWHIDVYNYPFHKEEGYTVIEKGNVEVLLLTMEKLNEAEQIIRGFLDMEEFTLTNENMGEQKWYQSVYKEFKQKIQPSEEYLNALYDSKYMKHFYTNDEVETFKGKYREETHTPTPSFSTTN
ncbi:putative capsular polysaccharide synthesis family protein [Halobacillus andaensis]|uniref:putative capsular polysaccharide synthesis family protein n=1 Tax=Halobacillus andaensis TaxID=1176239 RepID=UPI003D73A03F